MKHTIYFPLSGNICTGKTFFIHDATPLACSFATLLHTPAELNFPNKHSKWPWHTTQQSRRPAVASV